MRFIDRQPKVGQEPRKFRDPKPTGRRNPNKVHPFGNDPRELDLQLHWLQVDVNNPVGPHGHPNAFAITPSAQQAENWKNQGVKVIELFERQTRPDGSIKRLGTFYDKDGVLREHGANDTHLTHPHRP